MRRRKVLTRLMGAIAVSVPLYTGAATKATVQQASDATAAAGSSPSSAPSAGTVMTLGESRFMLLPLVDEPPPSKTKADGSDASWVDKAGAFLTVLATITTSLAWPIASLILVRWLLKAPQIQFILSRASRRITQLNVAGLEIKLSEGAAATLEDVQRLIRQVPDTHKEWVSNSHLGPQFQLVVADLKASLTSKGLFEGSHPLTADDFKSFRFTLHVPDVLLAHSFRQLVDYIGCARGGAGRIFSMRMGIIGKAWRAEQSEFVPNDNFSDQDLIEKWGMTRVEAHDTSRGKKIHLAVLIKSDAGLPLAVFYCDSGQSALFGQSNIIQAAKKSDPASHREGQAHQVIFDAVEKLVLEACRARKLIDSLEALEAERIKLPQIDLYELRNA